ncbi:MAG: biotin/lipoyl-binding protein, partial [Defluviitaleaceae bacterium]|nr:biotin/lipoyl-binding protein [Defluviitaleaceae bacterium]
MKKIFCIIGIICLSILLAACSSNDALPAATTFSEGRATPPTTPDTLTVRGVVESVESRNIYSTLGFLTERVYVEVGDVVTAGQTLATLDTEDLTLMIAQQKVELELIRQMAEILPPQRQAELETIRQTAVLAPRQQRAELNVARQSNANMLEQTRRMYTEAAANLENNTNMHIISAEAALTAAEINLTNTRRSYDIARADYE